MTFELDKQYIVEVTKNGIIPMEEFKRERFFDKDSDNLDFLTDEEEITIINDVLDKIKTEILLRDKNVKDVRTDGRCFFTVNEIFEIINKHIIKSEVKNDK